MRPKTRLTAIAARAPGILGAMLLSAALLTGSSCERSKGSPEWTKVDAKSPVSPTDPAATPAAAKPEAPPAKPKTAAESSTVSTDTPTTEGLRFISYNVENWLTMDRYVAGKSLKAAPKPESEKQAVVKILTQHAPDIIGLCEIGLASDLAEIQQDLKAAGLDLPHSHFTGGSDPTRHLGLLSRFPITSTATPEVTEYQLAGQTFAINRGILDASIEARGKSYRFLGLHLKSKREIEGGDQEAIRLNEARLLRRHLGTILQADPQARVVVYGDFNDTRATPAIKAISGSYNDPGYLTALPMKDSRQMAWTHHWALQDIYSRIDFIMVTKALRKDVDFPAAKIIDDANWDKASDHRAVMAIFK
jgi:endonuclease/exonuclease/phosphatase family metal-dependent hydrolase